LVALREARDANGQKLVDLQGGARLDAPITYIPNGVLPATRSPSSATIASPYSASGKT
jgi:hypothetical protein